MVSRRVFCDCTKPCLVVSWLRCGLWACVIVLSLGLDVISILRGLVILAISLVLSLVLYFVVLYMPKPCCYSMVVAESLSYYFLISTPILFLSLFIVILWKSVEDYIFVVYSGLHIPSCLSFFFTQRLVATLALMLEKTKSILLYSWNLFTVNVDTCHLNLYSRTWIRIVCVFSGA